MVVRVVLGTKLESTHTNLDDKETKQKTKSIKI